MLNKDFQIAVVCGNRGQCYAGYAGRPKEGDSSNELAVKLPTWTSFAKQRQASPSRDPVWLAILADGLHHQPYCVEATAGGQTIGILPLCYVHSLLFGRFLVGLPYLNVGGPIADEADVVRSLIDRAVALADELKVRYLELRHEKPIEHPALTQTLTSKVHMRLALPDNSETLWKRFDPKVRNQIRKAEKNDLTVQWGGQEFLSDFYSIFAHNMRDLGTPVFGRKLFQSILHHMAGDAELCVVRHRNRPVASGLLLHGSSVTEVPSASSLRSHNFTNANMLMYWHFLQRAITRGQHTFDFGRSSHDSNTYRFKKQWGAKPEPATWQYYVREGMVSDMRLESGKYDRMVRLWRRLPVFATRWIGPFIVRGIP
jgi:FemAB-related protein (PEP-CTERM system-associated)